MSSSIDNTNCPSCGGNARSEQDTKTCKIHIWCTECGYDSNNGDYDYDFEEEYNYDQDVFDDVLETLLEPEHNNFDDFPEG